jgi:hypothetical protein
MRRAAQLRPRPTGVVSLCALRSAAQVAGSLTQDCAPWLRHSLILGYFRSPALRAEQHAFPRQSSTGRASATLNQHLLLNFKTRSWQRVTGRYWRRTPTRNWHPGSSDQCDGWRWLCQCSSYDAQDDATSTPFVFQNSGVFFLTRVSSCPASYPLCSVRRTADENLTAGIRTTDFQSVEYEAQRTGSPSYM